MPFRNGRARAQASPGRAAGGYLGLTLKLRRPVQNRHMHEREARDQNERSRFTPTLRAVAMISAQASSDSGTPLCARLARLARSGSPGVRIASPGMAFALLEPVEIARHVGVEDMRGIDLARVEVEREHAVGEFAVGLGCAIAGERSAEEFANQREAGALVLAEGADRARARRVVARPVRRSAARRSARDRRRARRRDRSTRRAAAACRRGSRH